MRKPILAFLLFLTAFFAGVSAHAQADYRLGAGDVIRIQVFQNPDLTLETRVAESGVISYPLIGAVAVGGLTAVETEMRIAHALQDGGFVQQPQVTVVLIQNRSNQVAVLGQVNRPGRFPLEQVNTRLTDMLATAGGIAGGGADVVIVLGTRDGKAIRNEIDLVGMFLDNRPGDDILVAGGDVIYVHRAPVFYIYGEAQRPSAYRVERGMTVMQALALGGGPTVRGTENRLRMHRRNAAGVIERIVPELTDPILPDDVLYIRESLF